MSKEVIQQQDSFEKLKNEVSILRKTKDVGSDHIIKLIEMVETPGNFYMIMELCNGGDLYKLLQARKNFSEVEARFLLGQIASGLSVIDNLNVVHRDLKLDNIFVHFKNLSHEKVFGDPIDLQIHKSTTSFNEDVHIVIGDLGFAR